MEKRYLFTPGPTPVPPEVLAAGAEPIVHHRGADFRVIYERALERLRDVYRTSADVLLFAASGTGAMESAVANLGAAGERVAVVSRRVASASGGLRSARSHGLEVQAIRYEWGETPDPARGRRRRRATPASSSCSASSPTPRPVSSPMCERSRRRSATRSLVVDAISSLGAVPLETDAWGIDVVLSGSQKALMCPPGLAIASVPEHVPGARATAVAAASTSTGARPQGAQDKLDAAFTPAVSLIRSLDVALGLLLDAGLEARVRAPHPPRPRRARRDQGDGPRALLARRRLARPS